jgi:hypothetical protein
MDRLAAVFLAEMHANSKTACAAVRVRCLQMTLTAACWRSSGKHPTPRSSSDRRCCYWEGRLHVLQCVWRSAQRNMLCKAWMQQFGQPAYLCSSPYQVNAFNPSFCVLRVCWPLLLQELLPAADAQHQPRQLAVGRRLCAVIVATCACKPHRSRSSRQQQRQLDGPQPPPCCEPPHCGGQPRQRAAPAVCAVAVRRAQVRRESLAVASSQTQCLCTRVRQGEAHHVIRCGAITSHQRGWHPCKVPEANSGPRKPHVADHVCWSTHC